MKNTSRPPDADLALPMVKVAIERYERRMSRDMWKIRGAGAIAGAITGTGLALLGVPAVAIILPVYAATALCGLLFGIWMAKRASKETP